MFCSGSSARQPMRWPASWASGWTKARWVHTLRISPAQAQTSPKMWRCNACRGQVVGAGDWPGGEVDASALSSLLVSSPRSIRH
jgi:hypothetical protein